MSQNASMTDLPKRVPSTYETRARDEILAWKSPQLGWFDKAMQFVNWPLDKGGDLLMKAPGIGWVIEKSVGGLINLTNDVAQWSVRPETIFEEYRKNGELNINGHASVKDLDLERVDRTIGWLGAKYKGCGTTEGAAFGVMGLPGIPLDIVSIITLNLRAVGEYATYCGFDVSTPHERLFAMNVLGLASSPSDASKGLALAQLIRIAQDVAKKRAWKDLEKHAFVKVIQRLAKVLGIRLTKAKLAQVVPYAGAFIGGGFNAYFTAKVCDAAYFLYRERFLAAKYGPDFIAAPTKPAETVEAEYPEEQEDLPQDTTPPAGT